MNPGAEPADDAAQPLRSDAERNRARIIAGRAHGVQERRPERLDGLGGPPGGVGIATLFRRFPTKEDLVAAVFADRMDAYAEVVADALDDPDPWHGLVGIIESVCAMQAADYGFADVLTMTFPTATALEQRRLEVYHAVVQLIDRATAAGRLREDFTPKTSCSCTWPTPASSTPPAIMHRTPGDGSSP
jgi:hypothetical protein